MNINLREIKYILAIADEGNITKAAQKLYIAQPSLSQAVKKVETDLGQPLFSRVKGRIKLTQAGEQFVEAGKRIIGITDEMEARLADLASMRSGTMYLGAPYHLGAYVVPELLSVFRKQYPGVDVILHEGTSDELETLILDGRIDAAVMPLPIKNPNIVSHPFFKSRMVLVMSPDDPLNALAYRDRPDDRRLTFDLRNAADASFLIGKNGQRIRKVTQIIFQNAGIAPNIVMRSQNVETLGRIAATGYGLAIMPEHYLRNLDLLHSASCYYLPEHQDYEWTIVLSYYQHAEPSLPVKHLIRIMDDSSMRNIYE